MNIQLIKGSFEAHDARELITKLIQSKINYHESKIENGSHNEEDIKMRERRIIALQNELKTALSNINTHAVELNATVDIKPSSRA